MREKHPMRPHKITVDLRKKIMTHILSFRERQSHYSQEKTRHIYLPEELNINKMFNMFMILHPNVKIC